MTELPDGYKRSKIVSHVPTMAQSNLEHQQKLAQFVACQIVVLPLIGEFRMYNRLYFSHVIALDFKDVLILLSVDC